MFSQLRLGAVQPVESANIILPANTVTGQTTRKPALRRRRRQAAEPLVGPECKNLPENINWVEKKKLAPVQDQGECGIILTFRYE